MKAARKLFRTKYLYDLEQTEDLFVKAMRENCEFCYQNCPDYRRILDEADFSPSKITSMEALTDLPFLPTLYFKHHELTCVPEKKLMIAFFIQTIPR